MKRHLRAAEAGSGCGDGNMAAWGQGRSGDGRRMGRGAGVGTELGVGSWDEMEKQLWRTL